MIEPRYTQFQEVRVRATDPARPNVVFEGRNLVVATGRLRKDGIVDLFELGGSPALGIHQDWLGPTGRVVPEPEARVGLNRHICDGVAYMYSYHAPSKGAIDLMNNRYLLEYVRRYEKQDLIRALRWGCAQSDELFTRYFELCARAGERVLMERAAHSPARFARFLETLLAEIAAIP